jgi:MoaA/NifB/PqqE/SkfB family radical SAM enzyme
MQSVAQIGHDIVDGIRSFKWPARPEKLGLEITAACDARCIHCPLDKMDRLPRPMEFELFKRIVDEAKELKFRI